MVEVLQIAQKNLFDEETSSIDDKLRLLLKDGPKTRPELVDETEIPRTTIYDGLKRLIVAGVVKKEPIHVAGSGRGRPRVAFSLKNENV